jgi:DNA-binding XRE family transcriptional regulator
MIILTPAVASPLLTRAGEALGLSQRDLAEALGVSRRTLVRWVGGKTDAGVAEMTKLARLVYPRDPQLAAEIAAACHDTLQGIGLLVPASMAPAPAPPPPPAPRPRPSPLVVDAVVCAAADAMQGPPASVRPMVLAAFERAEALELTVSDVVSALRGEAPADGKAKRATAKK